MTNRFKFSPALTAALLLILVLSALAFYPVSFMPHRLSVTHRTASNHAMLMYAFDDYFKTDGAPILTRVDIWSYPQGGIVRPIALPALAIGWPIAHLTDPRTAFNSVLLMNLVLSGLTFYWLMRKLRFGAAAAIAAASLSCFHPFLQSFIMRGQIENTMLWPVGLMLLCVLQLLRAKQRHWAWFLALIAGALVTLVSTPYYAIFTLALMPFFVAFVMVREHVEPRSRSFLWCSGAFLVTFLILIVGIRFYRPDVAKDIAIPNISPGSFAKGLEGIMPAESLLDLVNPHVVLECEMPYLGLAFLATLILAVGYRLRRSVNLRSLSIMLLGAVSFALLALGRRIGAPDAGCAEGIPLPVALVDQLFPPFRNIIRLVRAFPFMSMCGGLIVAEAIDNLTRKISAIAAVLVVGLVAADGLLTSPLAQRTHPRYFLDVKQDVPAEIALLRAGSAPVLDLPPPYGKTGPLWTDYSYFQTEHLQKLAWGDVIPEPVPRMMSLTLDLFNQPRSAQPLELQEWASAVSDAGIARIVYHLGALPPEREQRDCTRIDRHFARIQATPHTVIWAVPSSQ